MPIFLDRHDAGEVSAEDVAQLHVKDLEIQDKYGVKFLTYWYDATRGTTFCLVDAPNKETADRVHAEAHGHMANEMIAVDLSAVEAFLGRIQDPPSARTKPIDDSAVRGLEFQGLGDTGRRRDVVVEHGQLRRANYVRFGTTREPWKPEYQRDPEPVHCKRASNTHPSRCEEASPT